MKQAAFAAIVVVTGGLLAGAGCGRAGASVATAAVPDARAPVAVVTEPVRTTVTPMPARAVGRLSADKSARLGFKIGGVVARVLADDGARVRRGQLLAVLDVAEIDAQVRQAEAGAKKAERDLTRVVDLEKTGGVSRRDREDAQTARDVANEQLNVAAFNQKHAAIVAPFAGRIVKRLIEAGEVTGPGAPAFTMQSDERALVAEVGLTEADAVRVKVGDPATVVVPALARTVTGVVEELGPEPTPGAATWTAKIQLPALPDAPAGLPVSVTIVPAGRAVRLIPASALVAVDGRRATVFTVAAGAAHRVDVEIRAVREDGIEIAPSAHEIELDRVVVGGKAWLEDGSPVTEAAPSAAAPAGSAR